MSNAERGRCHMKVVLDLKLVCQKDNKYLERILEKNHLRGPFQENKIGADLYIIWFKTWLVRSY